MYELEDSCIFNILLYSQFLFCLENKCRLLFFIVSICSLLFFSLLLCMFLSLFLVLWVGLGGGFAGGVRERKKIH